MLWYPLAGKRKTAVIVAMTVFCFLLAMTKFNLAPIALVLLAALVVEGSLTLTGAVTRRRLVPHGPRGVFPVRAGADARLDAHRSGASRVQPDRLRIRTVLSLKGHIKVTYTFKSTQGAEHERSASAPDVDSIDLSTLTVPSAGAGERLASIRWEGQLVAPVSGTYNLGLESHGPALLSVDGRHITRTPGWETFARLGSTRWRPIKPRTIRSITRYRKTAARDSCNSSG
jgi:hypothetical protein